jgi:Domain of unknown function (DUF1833)
MPTQNEALLEAYAAYPPSARIYYTLEIWQSSFDEPARIVANVGDICFSELSLARRIDSNTMAIREFSLPDQGAPGSPSVPTTQSDTAILRAAISADSIRPLVRSRSGYHPADRSRSLTASSSQRTLSGTASPRPSRTRSCGSIRRRRSFKAGLSRAAATSFAIWMWIATAIR